jgi:FMN phosphatase YigB (HAD superfamily)
MTQGSPSTVFLFDVDNTLLNHDRVTADLRRHLDEFVGPKSRRYWEIFEQLRSELGYADYLGALQRYRVEHLGDNQLLEVSYYLINYPFAHRLFPGSIDAVEYAQKLGTAVILTDGDVVFQPRKIYRSGLYELFRGNVLIYIHKERQLADVECRYPADHYVVVDDKLRILAAIKEIWGSRVTTVFVRQGHYALDEKANAQYMPADISIENIAEFAYLDASILEAVAAPVPAAPNEPRW